LEREREREVTDKSNDDEVSISEYTLENVQLVVKPPAIDRVEDLSEDEDIEHERLDNSFVMLCMIQSEDRVAEEVEDEDYRDLVYRLSEDHLDHVGGEEPRSTSVRLPV
jgi:hypothetical protein